MVNMPINVSAFPMDEIALVTDINQNINQEYYEWLLKQHNYFPDCAFHKEKFEDTIKMEHSYTRDWKPTANGEVMETRTILVERAPLCPSCHQLPPNHDEKVDTPEPYSVPIPTYNEEAGRRELNATENMIKSCHNPNSDTDDWTENIQKINWTVQQLNLFSRVERILDMDQLGRLAVTGLSNECLRRNAIIEKSVSRMRAVLASVHWEPRLTSWLHSLLMTHLPSNYMVSYIDILQTLKRKIPILVDKMLYHRPIEMHKDYMSAIMKRPWEPIMITKTRTLPSNPVIILVSTTVNLANGSSREKRWMELLGTLTSVETTTVNLQSIDPNKPIEQVTEQLVAMTRAKIQQIRNHTPNRHIILAGFNAGAAIALQVALVEPVNSIFCLGFAFNTLVGVRGNPDDRILDLSTPILFVIGQNAQRSSQEEIESLREHMNAQTLLVIVGSSDDALRVKRLNRSMEGVSQSMIDNMIMDEIQEFATSCILNPPGPRNPKPLNGHRKASKQRAHANENGQATKRVRLNGNQKTKAISHTKSGSHKRVPKILNGIHKETIDLDDESLQLAFESVLPSDLLQNGYRTNENECENHVILNGSPSIRQKVKYIPANQFVHIKPPPINTQKIYVKQQNGNKQSYTLGVKNIGTCDIPGTHNKLITVKNKEHSNQSTALNQINEENSITNAMESDPNMENINIFEIPILFADYDGNILENQSDNETPMTPEPEQPEIGMDFELDLEPEHFKPKIEIISQEIITEARIDIDQRYNEQSDSEDTDELPSTPTKFLKRSHNFMVLNKSALSKMRPVKPTIKFKKIIFPTRGSTNTSRTYASPTPSSIDSKSVCVSPVVPRFQSFTRLSPNHDDQPSKNGRSESPKSGILIKRNHLKNITIRRVNVMQTGKFNEFHTDEMKNGDVVTATQNDSKVDSLKSLIADPES